MHNWLKAVVICCAFICMSNSMIVSAQITNGDNNIKPQMTLITYYDCSINQSNGSVTAIGTVLGYSTTVIRCEISMEIQEKTGLFWHTVSSWTSSCNSYSWSTSGNYATSSGAKYRAVMTVTVYSTNNSETVTSRSNVVEAD